MKAPLSHAAPHEPLASLLVAIGECSKFPDQYPDGDALVAALYTVAHTEDDWHLARLALAQARTRYQAQRNPRRLKTLANITSAHATALVYGGHVEAAMRLQREALAIHHALNPASPDTLFTWLQHAQGLTQSGQFEAAIRAYGHAQNLWAHLGDEERPSRGSVQTARSFIGQKWRRAAQRFFSRSTCAIRHALV